MFSLKGKTALVTGASRGIGAGIARKLAQAGADVAITYVSSPDKAEALVAELKKSGVRALAVKADAGDAAAVKAAVNRVAQEFGRIDILVNNAGVAVMKPIADYTDEEYEHIMSVNVRGVFAATQAALAHIPDGGRIITIGSCLGVRVAFGGITLYSMSKSALISFNKGLAREVGARGITANVVQPGPIDTDMNPADGDSADAMRAFTALGRYGKPEDVGALVTFLASDEAGFITGSEVTIDGGTNA